MNAGAKSEFFVFLLSGGFAAAVNVISRYLLTPALGFEAAVAVAYGIGMVTAYALFRAVVFGRSGRGVASESYRFVLVNIVALALVWTVSVFLARVVFPAVHFFWHPQDVAHLIGVSVPAVSSYFGHKKYTFRR